MSTSKVDKLASEQVKELTEAKSEGLEPVIAHSEATGTNETPATNPKGVQVQVTRSETTGPRPSLSGLGIRSSKILTKSTISPKETEANSNDLNQSESFNEEQLIAVWNQIANQFKDGNLINKYVMMNREIHLIDGQIHLKVENEVQVQQFNESIRLELLTTLREKLRNSQIDIILDVLPEQPLDKKVLYTQEDKYNFLAEKYPILVEMKKQFGLDYEY
ncbi:hypothetical protein EOJ36_06800 [Sandaracinomonas limnophila]|uniref:DNA polymerase III subunit gamma/tau n=1 Tax=Sandaracinomonas limnophila TaxID=1862386 RepID=A0A437PR48_9BACT|nr:hypothetical protein [Sandaracinomonas limnophila]RVU24717.1 hypothetical protein EOJ36_06800 [Sandaracinomonas limnophila]